MSRVLVDTSVWIAFLRAGKPPVWRDAMVALLDLDQAVVVEPVIAELLVGARGRHERDTVLALAGGAQTAPVDFKTWVAAGDFGRAWQARGRTLALVDCLLAVVAVRDGLRLWSLDKDFDPVFAAGDAEAFAPDV